MRILIAEDDDVARLRLEVMLRKRGYEVVTAGDGARAWELLQREDAPALAILDWMMPGLDGVEVCRRVRQSGKDSYVYILMLTGRGDRQDLVAGMEAGADDYLSKPFDVEELHVRLRAGERILESERRFRQLADAMPQIVWRAQADGSADYFNRRWYDYTGLTLEQSRDMGWQAVLHPDDLLTTHERWRRSVATGEHYETEFRLRRDGDGMYLWHLSRAEPIRDAAGEIELWFGTCTDIEDKKRAEASLKRAYDHEHRIAAALQRSLLMSPREEAFPGLEVEPFYDPALDDALIGGDFYDLFPLEGGWVAFVVGDVSGKGLAAATHTSEVKYALRAYLRTYEEPDLARTLPRLNRFLCEAQALEGRGFGTFVVLSVAVIDTVTGEARIATAGAEAPLVLRADGGVEMVEVTGLPLGLEPRGRYTERSVRLAPGETLLLCTDGLTEARRGDELLGNEGVAHLAQQAAIGHRPLGEMSRRIVEGARAFAGGKLQDDACLLLIRRDMPNTY